MPSPLVEQWIDYTLSPGRINMRVGLKGACRRSCLTATRAERIPEVPTVSRPVLGKDEGDMLKGGYRTILCGRRASFSFP